MQEVSLSRARRLGCAPVDGHFVCGGRALPERGGSARPGPRGQSSGLAGPVLGSRISGGASTVHKFET